MPMQDIILGKCIKMTFLYTLCEKGENKSGSAYGHTLTMMAAFPLVFMKIFRQGSMLRPH